MAGLASQYACWAFMWVLGIQSLVPTFVPKVIYPLSYLSTWLVGGSLDQGSGGGEGWAPGTGDLRHSGSMHFSTCSSSSLQSPSSARDLSIRWRVRMPFPQVTLQSLHSDQGDSKHGMVSRSRAEFGAENRHLLLSFILAL